MNPQLSIALILGTGREGRASEKIARYVEVQAKAFGFAVTFVDVRDYALPFTTHSKVDHEKTNPWKAIAANADGFIIVAPEYNHGYPGELKILLDKLFIEYARKPVAVCAVSKGALGGSRMLENLRPVLIELRMAVLGAAVYFSNAQELFNATGAMLDASYEVKLKKLFDELAWYARALKEARATVV
ncbi:NAD(P)H-dependent oxidoreductase [Candidatus Uhrbacteria bacterium]|nr:NAD(P)H-dependent oxidoreductase [Candidatus Uhrbacteria bacterium]